MGGHRSSRAYGSADVKVTKVPVATAATSANVLPANPSRALLSALNKTDVVVQVYLLPLDRIGEGQTVELAVGQYWEDPGNWQGAVTVQSATTATGNVNFTEWL